MPLTASDIVPLTQARATLSDLADQVKAGAEKIITNHRLERERIHLLLLDEVEKGLADVEAGRTRDAREALAELMPAAAPARRRSGKR